VPTYEITAPDGHRYQITAPEGASEQDVLGYAQNQFSAQPPAHTPAPAEAQEQGRLDRWSDDMRRMRDEFGAIQQNVVRGAKEGEGPYALPVVGPMRHAVDTVGTGLGGLWSTVGHAAGGAADAVTYGLGSGLAALAGDKGGPLTDAVNTIGAGADAVGSGAKAFFLPPTTRQGLDAIGRGWQSIPPDARRTLGATGEIVGTFAPIPGVGKSAAGMAGSASAGAGRALERAGTAQAMKNRAQFIKDLIEPLGTAKQMEADLSLTAPKGFLQVAERGLSPREANMASVLMDVPGLSQNKTLLGNWHSMDGAVSMLDDRLKRQLFQSDFQVSKKELMGEMMKEVESLLKSPAIVGDQEASIRKLWPTIQDVMAAAPETPLGFLEARQALDKALLSARSGGRLLSQEGPESALKNAALGLRRVINKHLYDRVKDVATQDTLFREHNILSAMRQLGPKAAREAKGPIGRYVQSAAPRGWSPKEVAMSFVDNLGKPYNRATVEGAGIGAMAAGPMGAAIGAPLGLGLEALRRGAMGPTLKRGLGRALQGKPYTPLQYSIPNPRPGGIAGYLPEPPIYAPPPSPPPRLPPPSGPAPAGAYVVSPDGSARGVPQHEAINMAAASRAQEAAYAKAGLTPDVRMENFRRAMRNERNAAYDALSEAQKNAVEAQVEAMYRGQQVSVEEMVKNRPNNKNQATPPRAGFLLTKG
jgi:hypothetical protein